MDTRVAIATTAQKTAATGPRCFKGPAGSAGRARGPGRVGGVGAAGEPPPPRSSAASGCGRCLLSQTHSPAPPGPSRGPSGKETPPPPSRARPATPGASLPESEQGVRDRTVETQVGPDAPPASRRKTPPRTSCHWLSSFRDEKLSLSVGWSSCRSPRRLLGNVVLSQGFGVRGAQFGTVTSTVNTIPQLPDCGNHVSGAERGRSKTVSPERDLQMRTPWPHRTTAEQPAPKPLDRAAHPPLATLRPTLPRVRGPNDVCRRGFQANSDYA